MTLSVSLYQLCINILHLNSHKKHISCLNTTDWPHCPIDETKKIFLKAAPLSEIVCAYSSSLAGFKNVSFQLVSLGGSHKYNS